MSTQIVSFEKFLRNATFAQVMEPMLNSPKQAATPPSATNPTYKFANQFAFPGGIFEPSDKDLLETALREAQEEIFLENPEEIKKLKLINETVPIFYTKVMPIIIKPFVFLAEEPLNYSIQPKEVARLFEIKFSDLKIWEGENCFHDFYASPVLPIKERDTKFRVNLWGATFRILENVMNEKSLFLKQKVDEFEKKQ